MSTEVQALQQVSVAFAFHVFIRNEIQRRAVYYINRIFIIISEICFTDSAYNFNLFIVKIRYFGYYIRIYWF